MKIPIVQLGSALLFGLAGFCVFLMLLNRVIIHMTDRSMKGPIILFTFVCLAGGCSILGFFFHRTPWVYAPIALLCLALLGEVRRLLIRRSCIGVGPINTTPHKVAITSPVSTMDLIVHRYKVSTPKWKRDPIRIVHLTDLHVHPSLPLEYYEQVLTLAEQANPDIAVFTGDFISGINALPKLRKVLRPIAKLGSYAVLGNHDYWVDADAVRTIIKDSGLSLLTNESILLPVKEQNIAITGYDYPWGTKTKSIRSQEELLHIVLSHTPDNIYKISQSLADLVFSGHFHAGQIRIPVVGSVVIPSVYGRRFDHGHFVVNNTHLFVASGVGSGNPPLRVYCQPDIFIVDIFPETNDANKTP